MEKRRYSSTRDTNKHIKRVQQLGHMLIRYFGGRLLDHDRSKLKSPEKEYFDIYTPKLKDTTYGSDEYNQYLKELKPALDHHYEMNEHHPEHFENGIKGMTLIDLLEMLCDWKASSERHADGDIIKSIELGKERFGYNDMLAQIFKNTIQELNWIDDLERRWAKRSKE